MAAAEQVRARAPLKYLSLELRTNCVHLVVMREGFSEHLEPFPCYRCRDACDATNVRHPRHHLHPPPHCATLHAQSEMFCAEASTRNALVKGDRKYRAKVKGSTRG